MDTLMGFLIGLWWAQAIGLMVAFSVFTLGRLLKPDTKQERIDAILVAPVVLFLDFVVFSKSWQYFTEYLTGA